MRIYQVYRFTSKDERCIEQVVNRDEVQINHIVLPPQEKLPEHYSNSNVYLVVVRGVLYLTLEGEERRFSAGSIVAVPYRTRMDVRNEHSEVLEFLLSKRLIRKGTTKCKFTTLRRGGDILPLPRGVSLICNTQGV